MKSPALTSTPLSVRLPAPGSVVIFTALSALAGLSAASLKPKSAAAEGVRRVLQRGDRVVGARRRIVDRGHVDAHGIGGLIQVHATVGGAAVVLHLEGEARVARAVGVGHRGEHQLAARDVGRR